jgi:hypothetical protein
MFFLNFLCLPSNPSDDLLPLLSRHNAATRRVTEDSNNTEVWSDAITGTQPNGCVQAMRSRSHCRTLQASIRRCYDDRIR